MRNAIAAATLLTAVAAGALAPAPVAAAAPCDRACLTSYVDRYLEALVAHAPSRAPLASNVVFTENGSRLKPGDGLWKTAAKVATRRELYADVTTGQAGFWGVVDEGGSPAMLSLRIKVENEKIVEAETVVARTGSHSLFSPEPFAATPPQFAGELPAAQRVPRARLIAAANGYFDGIERSDNTLVPSATECNRFENGVQMTNRNGVITPRACAMAVDRLGYIKHVSNRRYFADEERGVVFSTVLFDIPEDAAATPPRQARMLLLSEVFKIVGGDIQRIETVMHNLPYGSSTGWPDR